FPPAFSREFAGRSPVSIQQLSIAALATRGVKRRIGASPWQAPFHPGKRLMTLWFVFALMTAAAIFAVLWPLGRSAPAAADGSEAVVYKDQLAEIDRDMTTGMIGAAEAEAARVE